MPSVSTRLAHELSGLLKRYVKKLESTFTVNKKTPKTPRSFEL